MRLPLSAAAVVNGLCGFFCSALEAFDQTAFSRPRPTPLKRNARCTLWAVVVGEAVEQEGSTAQANAQGELEQSRLSAVWRGL